MKIFFDKALTKEIEENKLDLGIVPAGETKRYNIWILNDNGTFINDLEFSIDHKEVKIIKYPKQMMNTERKELIFEWSPSVTLKEGLKTDINIKGKEIWG